MATISLIEIQKTVEELASQIDAPVDLLPHFGANRTDDAHPWIEVDGLRLMYYVVMERGKEYERRATANLQELLYWIFDHVAFNMACQFELNNRKDRQDSRRIMFAKMEELLGQLNPLWAHRNKAYHADVLTKHPFDDLSSLRASYCRELRGQGLTETEIDRIAFARYPLPAA